MNPGRTYSPESIFLQSWEVLLSSKGKQPQTMAKRMTPQLQMSTSRPWYFLLAIIQGAAQQGDPHAVLSIQSFLYVLLRPKSTILRLFFQSMRRFSGLRSRWTILRRCRYATPLMICLKYLQASFSSILVFLTIQSNSQPFSMYSMTRKRWRLVSMISYSWMMEGWRMSFRMWIYRETRSTSATSIIFYFTRILIATRSPVRVWVPSFTFPNVPSPIVFPIRQYPIFFYFPASPWFIILYNYCYNHPLLISHPTNNINDAINSLTK